MHDPRVGRFFAPDPLFRKYPFYSPYAFSGNRVIDATELEGLEPKIVVSDKETGFTELFVPNRNQVEKVIVKTYEATVGYVNNEGDYIITGTFNVTRDGFIGIGYDKKGQNILANHSSDPANNNPIYIESEKKEQYGKGTPAFYLSSIYSPIDDYNNSYHDGPRNNSSSLPEEMMRQNDTAQEVEIHVGGWYINTDGKKVLSGAYGCISVINPSQISNSPNRVGEGKIIESNCEMKEFGDALKTAKELDKNENGSERKPQVEIKTRKYEKKRTEARGTVRSLPSQTIKS